MIFDALAFPSYFFGSDGTLISESEGSLFDVPAAARTPAQIQFYQQLKAAGWHSCPLKYPIYARAITAEESGQGVSGMLVLPGLRVRGGARSNEAMQGVQALIDRGFVVRHVNSVLGVTADLADSFDKVTRQNIHEVKGINVGIYHAALRIEREVSKGDHTNIGELSRNIIALSQILAARTDFMKFVADSGSDEIEYGAVQVYKKFDRMRKCFTALAERQKVKVHISGSSFGSTYGPKSFLDLAAYILIDNAVKYSPQDEVVNVNVKEVGNIVEVRVSSIGPRIEDGETEAIFSRDVRSSAALRSGISGTGIGLYALRATIAEAFHGNVRLERGPHAYERAGILFDKVDFILELPAA